MAAWFASQAADAKNAKIKAELLKLQAAYLEEADAELQAIAERMVGLGPKGDPHRLRPRPAQAQVGVQLHCLVCPALNEAMPSSAFISQSAAID
jgi:hypothetical protein